VLIPSLCVLSSAALMVTAQGATMLRLGLYMAVGLALYAGYSRRRIGACLRQRQTL
jgi:hypothetical protein